jgi:SAM-dependent methyltransferase
MHDWIAELGAQDRVLDLGAGAGSLKGSESPAQVVIVDCDWGAFAQSYQADRRDGVAAAGEALPFASGVFDLVICHHVLEHIKELDGVLQEVRRVLKPSGRVYVSVPNGYGLCDGIYRWVFEGGDHVNRFRRQDLTRLVETRVGVKLVRWQKLYSSFAYLYRLKNLDRAILPQLPPRLRFIARVPSRLTDSVQAALYVLTRVADRVAGVDWALYGWAFYFDRAGGECVENPPFVNVCLSCGSGHAAGELSRYKRIFYRCPTCRRRGIYFPPFRNAR